MAAAPTHPALKLHATSGLRVGVYVGGGIAPASSSGYINATQILVENGVIASTVNFTDADVEALNAVDNPIDVLVVPGGYSPDEGTAMTPTGLNSIRSFVLSGGGYVSSCAGSYLAGTAQCCHDPSILSFCTVDGVVNATKPGCYATPWSIGLINMATLNPWARGHGPVNVSFTDEAIALLHLDPAVYAGKNVSILYWQGPIQDKSYPWTGFATLATYKSEISTGYHNLTAGVSGAAARQKEDEAQRGKWP